MDFGIARGEVVILVEAGNELKLTFQIGKLKGKTIQLEGTTTFPEDNFNVSSQQPGNIQLVQRVDSQGLIPIAENFHGQLVISDTFKIPSIKVPPIKEELPEFPTGLKARYAAFGSDEPVITLGSPSRRPHKKKKKSKPKRHKDSASNNREDPEQPSRENEEIPSQDDGSQGTEYQTNEEQSSASPRRKKKRHREQISEEIHHDSSLLSAGSCSSPPKKKKRKDSTVPDLGLKIKTEVMSGEENITNEKSSTGSSLNETIKTEVLSDEVSTNETAKSPLTKKKKHNSNASTSKMAELAELRVKSEIVIAEEGIPELVSIPKKDDSKKKKKRNKSDSEFATSSVMENETSRITIKEVIADEVNASKTPKSPSTRKKKHDLNASTSEMAKFTEVSIKMEVMADEEVPSSPKKDASRKKKKKKSAPEFAIPSVMENETTGITIKKEKLSDDPEMATVVAAVIPALCEMETSPTVTTASSSESKKKSKEKKKKRLENKDTNLSETRGTPVRIKTEDTPYTTDVEEALLAATILPSKSPKIKKSALLKNTKKKKKC